MTESYQSTKKYADLANELLLKHSIPPTPINYSVFFVYVGGTSPELNKSINLQLKDNKAVDCIFIADLFNKHISTNEHVEKAVLAPLNESIDNLLTKLDEQVLSDKAAVEDLEKIDKALANQKQVGSLSQIVSYLVKTVNKSVDQHKILSAELLKANNEMNELKDKLNESKKEAISDALTGLLNRRGCEEKLDKLDIEQTHTSLAIDIDHFKKINDNFGHFIGDKVLQRVANSIKATISDLDIAVRYGGEEFIVVIVNKDITEAKSIAERIRLSVSNLKLKEKSSDSYLPPISVSIGVAQTKGEQDWRQVFERADKALYEAKSSGRNCTVLAA